MNKQNLFVSKLHATLQDIYFSKRFDSGFLVLAAARFRLPREFSSGTLTEGPLVNFNSICGVIIQDKQSGTNLSGRFDYDH